MTLIDLYSQRAAVARETAGLSDDEKIAWLRRRGEVIDIPICEGFPRAYGFRSRTGIEVAFFLQDDRFVFVGDHTTLLE